MDSVETTRERRKYLKLFGVRRFFVKARSYVDFVQKIGSWHPEKAKYLGMKI